MKLILKIIISELIKLVLNIFKILCTKKEKKPVVLIVIQRTDNSWNRQIQTLQFFPRKEGSLLCNSFCNAVLTRTRRKKKIV